MDPQLDRHHLRLPCFSLAFIFIVEQLLKVLLAADSNLFLNGQRMTFSKIFDHLWHSSAPPSIQISEAYQENVNDNERLQSLKYRNTYNIESDVLS